MTAERSLLHVFSTFAVGGPQVRFSVIANALGPRYRHAILAMDGDYAARALLAPGLDVRLLDEMRPPKRNTLNNALAFRRTLAERRPDLLLTGNWGAIEWALANTPRMVPQVHIEDGFGPEESRGRLARRTLLRRFALRGKTVVAASETLRAIARQEWRIPEARLRFIANGVDAARFENAAPADEFGVAADGPLIGTVAAFRREKNLIRLVEAFAQIRAAAPARLAIIGDGPERGAIEARVRELGLENSVYLPGYRPDPAPALAAFDLYMISSDTEQAPVSLLEAMASGLAVAASDVGDIAAMTAPDNAPFITAPDAAALAGAATALIADGSLRARIGAANRAKCAGDYSEASMITAWRRLWDGEI